ncbi:Krueppel homolog 1-like [Condylostylus longicornis]|uniref:Krueppel homolog 1-like n=1 Tax=Condylostylus longicornis TaxID=2530218 RepID=UPI00244DAB0B|nr:Krueppel homolog 1-like [Condylostylus longicornis]XP_055389377.1 Krueppel homolog 1-like [Condylostylus longicornis]
MVYYPSLPLIVKSEHHRQLPQSQLCSPLNGETQIYHIPPSSQIHLLQHSSQQSLTGQTTAINGHHSNGNLNGTPTTLLIPTNSFLQNIKVENLSTHQTSNINSTSSISSVPSSSSLISSHQQQQQHQLPQQQQSQRQQILHQSSPPPPPTTLSSQSINQNNLSINSNSIVNSRNNNGRTPNANKPQFKCDQCNMIFNSKSAHTSHVKSHKKQQQHQQQLQQQDNNFSQNLITTNGNRLNSNGGILSPSLSPSGSSSTASLPTAIAQVSSTGAGSDPYQCNVCQKTFAVPARLIRHYRTHTGERPFECEFCHKMFSVKENLQVHRRIHTKERPYKCDVCGRAFEHSGKLHRHMRIHTGERPHKCSVCDKTFIQSGQLVIHMRTHTGEKPYKCPVEGCGKGFTCSKQLKVHSRTHTGEKPYHCDICFRDFGYNHVLKLHKVQHYGSKCYKCTICDETFKSKKEMEAHIKGHANELPDDDDPIPLDQSQKSEASPRQSSPSIVLQRPKIEQQHSPQPPQLLQQQHSPKPSSQLIQSIIPQHIEIKQEPRYRRSIESSCYETESSSITSPPSPIHQRIQSHIGTGSLSTENGSEMEILESDQTIDYHPSNSSSPNRNDVYTNVYTCFEQAAAIAAIQQQNQRQPTPPKIHHQQQQQQQQSQHPSINPALLAAATIASRRVEEASQRRRLNISSPPPASLSNESTENSNEENIDYYHKTTKDINNHKTMMSPPQRRIDENHTELYTSDYAYETLDALRQRATYFPPAPSVAEYKPSYRNNDIVRQVEAAIAGAGLSPPRSTSTESPERSSSPESDTMMMADRDVMTLPLRKRKLYMNDSQATKEVPQPVVRVSSVIQFAKAS